MAELINGRTPEEIKLQLEWKMSHCPGDECNECKYFDVCDEYPDEVSLTKDTIAIIECLESERDAALAKVPKWISVEERLPEDGKLVLVTMNGEIHGAKLFNRAYELACYYRDGEDEEGEYHIDGWELWDYRDGEVSALEVFYWMPRPEPPEEEHK